MLSAALLSSCSMLDIAKTAIGMGGGGPSLAIDATLGDKNQQIQVGDEIVAEQVGDRITAETVNEITYELDYWLLLIAISGWVLPTPASMFKGIKSIKVRKVD